MTSPGFEPTDEHKILVEFWTNLAAKKYAQIVQIFRVWRKHMLKIPIPHNSFIRCLETESMTRILRFDEKRTSIKPFQNYKYNIVNICM